MAPKQQQNQTAEEELEEAERTRLRTRAEATLVQRKVPTDTTRAKIPHALRRSDGADIVKRNTSRKKRYLFMFPGGFKLNTGARVGQLHGLATKTPRLTVDCKEGRILLKGFLAFPRNALMTLKGGVGTKRAVQVVDCFDTIVVFSEWAWVGMKEANPGSVPEPLPKSLLSGETPVWRTEDSKPTQLDDELHDLPIPEQQTSPKSGSQGKRRPALKTVDSDDEEDSDLADLPIDELQLPPRSSSRRKRVPTVEIVDSDDEYLSDHSGAPIAELQSQPRSSNRRKRGPTLTIEESGDEEDTDEYIP